MERRTIISHPLFGLWWKWGSAALFHAQIWCSPEWVKSLLRSPLKSPSMPDIVSEGFPPLTQLCVCVCVCVFFFHALGFEEGVSHDGSFLGVVTTIIVARLSSRTLLWFWVCDISWCPPQPTTFIHTHTLQFTCTYTHSQRRHSTGCTAFMSVCVRVWQDPTVHVSHVFMWQRFIQDTRPVWSQESVFPPAGSEEA